MKTIRFSLYMIATVALLSLNSCARQFNSIWVLYNETGCADPWHAAFEDDDEKFKAVKDYLKDEDIRAYKVEAGTSIDPAICQACFCETGKVLRAKIHEDDRSAAVEAGWYVEK
jgi:hypothetical protein